jgi:alanyl-tRNA synthetase
VTGTIGAGSLRSTFLAFFAERGHVIVPSASLITEDDPSVLFTTAGVHPLLPYPLGRPHPAGKLLADCQRCLRTTDIAEVGDTTHLTFFEMLGNWSLGAYFKRESITWSHVRGGLEQRVHDLRAPWWPTAAAVTGQRRYRHGPGADTDRPQWRCQRLPDRAAGCAREAGFGLDVGGFERLFAQHRQRSRRQRGQSAGQAQP